MEQRHDVELLLALDQDERRLDELLVHLVREVLLEGATVEGELAGAGHEADAGDGLLATADRLRRTGGDDRGQLGLGVGHVVGTAGVVGLAVVLGDLGGEFRHRVIGELGLGGDVLVGHWATCLIS